MVYVYIASFVGFFASVISMAEIASMYVPTTRIYLIWHECHALEEEFLINYQCADFRWSISLG